MTHLDPLVRDYAVLKLSGRVSINAAVSNGRIAALGDHHLSTMEFDQLPGSPIGQPVPHTQTLLGSKG